MKTQDTHKKRICFAPWIHSYLGPQGHRALCCVAKPFVEDYKDFASYWNSKELKRIRAMMLKGQLPKEYCSVCLNGDKHSNLPLNNYKVSKEFKERILSQTSTDGYYEGSPIVLDYRGNNICNLSCRTCNSVYSSKIEAVLDPNKKKQSFSKLIEEQRSLITAQTNKLYFAMGEAFLQKSHWELLDSIFRSGHSRHIVLWYNTNLQFPLSILEKNKKILARFKEIRLNISIDGGGETGEFIRDGLSWEKFIRNFQSIKREPIFNIVNFNITLTLPFLLDYKELIDFLDQENIYVEAQMIIEGGFYQTLLSPYLLEPEDLQRQCIEIIDYINTKKIINLIGLKKMLLSLSESAFKVNRVKYSEKGIGKALVLAEEVDRKFNRVPVANYYRKFPLSREIIENSIERHNFEQKQNFELPFWQQYEKETYIFPSLQDIRRYLADPYYKKDIHSFIVSDSTLLSRLLNKGEEEKFAAQCLIEKLRTQHAYTIKKERLGPFIFLFYESKWRRLAQIIDIITFPIRGVIGFHSRYIILPRE